MRRIRRLCGLGLLAALVPQPAQAADAAAPIQRFEELLLRTRYIEAEAAAKRLLADHPKSARARCAVARLLVDRGRYTKALEELNAARRLNFKLMEARARRAELLERLGRRAEAVKDADAVIEFYNENAAAVTAPRELAAVGAALRLVNAPKDALRVLTKAQRAAPSDHRATLELGHLFLLKGQVTDASKEFNTVLRAAPKHPGARLGLAACAFSIGKLEDAEKHTRQALESAPNSAAAHDLLAAMAVIDDDFEGAGKHVERSLAVNPNDVWAHAIRAGSHLVRGNRAGFDRAEAAVRKVNPRCADFYTYVGRACTRKRRMTLAETLYRTAIRLDPEAYGAMAALGQHLFRRARYGEAKPLLEASHRIDGFNVRTYNTLNLLDKMEKYRAFSAKPALVVRLDDDHDGVLGEYVKEHALRALADLSTIYAHRPTQPITVEVLPSQRYFAARVIGLPHVGAIGVCFGNVVAMTTPRVQGGRINWRETLRHELTHAVNLLGTGYRIPHWLTEGMAVHEQQSDRPYNWDVLLKTSARLGRLIPLRKLTKGFTRPKNAEQRMLAYCQSEVVLDFFLKKRGAKCLPELMKAFREGKELPDAVKAVTGKELGVFEKECMAYVRAVAAGIPVPPRVTPRDATWVLDHAAKNPNDAEAQCNRALLLAGQRKTGAALEAAEKALKANPACAEAHYIQARIYARQRKQAESVAAARAAVRCAPGYAPAHYLLAEAAQRGNQTAEAIKHFRAAIQGHPRFPHPYTALAKIYKDRKQEGKMAAVLEALVRHTSNSLAPCIELGRYYVKKKQWGDAARVADVAIGIGPFSAEPHMLAGHAWWEMGQAGRAVREMEVAAICADKSLKAMSEMYRRLLHARRTRQAAALEKRIDAAQRKTAANNLRLARAYLRRGDRKRAKTAALAAFELDPNNEEVQALLQDLKR